MGAWDSGSSSDVLKTDSLATCIRIAIVGDYPADARAPPGSPDRFLAHVVEAQGRPAELAELVAKVKVAVAAGLTNLRATVVLCAPQSLGLDVSGEVTPEVEAKIKLMVSEQEDQNDKVMGDVESLVDVDHVDEVQHNCQEEWKLEITGTKQVQYGKQ